MSTLAPEDRPLCGQKRRKGAIEEEDSTIATLQYPWRSAKRRCQSQQESSTEYWDSLSKLWLTRRALDELDRRTKASPVKRTVSRGLSLGDKPGQPEKFSKQLKRFARYGGPDLRELRGVSSPR